MFATVAQVASMNEIQTADRIRRRNAEQAYQKNERYHESKQDKIAKMLVDSILDDETSQSKKDTTQLHAGQMKQVHLPIGRSLEETIHLWNGVRSEALAAPELAERDYKLATKASMNINRAEAQLGLNRQAEAEVDEAVYEERVAAYMRLAEGFSSPLERTVVEHGERFKKAVTAYSFQVQQKLSGFKVNTPSFLKIA